MNTTQLECFIAVAEHLNFSRASQELNISQPAVSHQIRALEDELQVRLFRRTSKSVELTEEGMLFLADARHILKTSFDAKQRLSKHVHSTTFEIGCHNTLELNLLPRLLRPLCKKYPQLRPTIQFFPPSSIKGLIDSKKIHAAFGFEEKPDLPSLKFRELCQAKLVCVCSPHHPLAQNKTVAREQLTDSIIAFNPHQIPDALFALQSTLISERAPQQPYFAPNVESALTLVKAQLGYVLLFDVPALRDPQLCYLPIHDWEQTLPFGICYRADDDHPLLREILTLCTSASITESVES